ncbi:MAG: ribosomal protein S18-alanine N-acetyltransferase [Cyanophyceae cyanobacterium]
MKLKQLQTEQLEQVVQLDQLCLGGLWSLAGYQREIDSPNSVLLGILASADAAETLIGMGCFWAILEEAHITLLAIHPHYQRKGLGNLLLCSLLKVAVERQLERATLEVRPSNQAALSLYQKWKFKIAGRRKNYYQHGEDALILWRGNLGQPEFEQDLARIWQQIQADFHKQGISLTYEQTFLG